MSVGRNELCPCGSGKKYKKCCGIVTPIAHMRNLREQKLRNEYTSWLERLNRYVSTRVQHQAIDAARERFADETGLSVQASIQPQWAIHFFNWFIFDYQVDGTTLLETYLQTDGRRMDTNMKQAFRAMSLGLYDILEQSEDMLAVRDVVTGQTHFVVGVSAGQAEPGQLLLGRLLTLGSRQLLLAGSLILDAELTPMLHQWLRSYEAEVQTDAGAFFRAHATELYRLIVQSGEERPVARRADILLRRVYRPVQTDSLRQRLEQHGSFELKKWDGQQEIWVYAARKEEHLFSTLDNALLELHEVIGELLIQPEAVVLESFVDRIDEMADSLGLCEWAEEAAISALTSTGSKLMRGTIFITSQPPLPQRVLQWAVQTYFAEKWLVTPHPELHGLAPVLAAASDNASLHGAVERMVAKVEHDSQLNQGPGRFMRLDLLRPKLALPNQTLHVANLLRRPLIEGLPESEYTVRPERLEEIARFVAEMTEGKSDATVKKYDEAMNLFRSFVRSAFGPGFEWPSLRPEEVAYFLVHDVIERVDNPTKTLAANLLSVLAGFFKWLDKQTGTQLAGRMQPLLGALKEELPEAYRLRVLLQKAAAANLHDAGPALEFVAEEALVLQTRDERGWLVKRGDGEEIALELEREAADSLAPDWTLAGLIGRRGDGRWCLYGTPELYPPHVSAFLGVQVRVLV